MFFKNEDMFKNLDIYKCQIIEYKNKDLQILQSIDIPITHNYSIYYFKIIFFDGNKIAFYLYRLIDSYYHYPHDDSLTIFNMKTKFSLFIKIIKI